MRKLFTPDYYIHGFDALTPAYLKKYGIQLLACDIDNTLIPHDEELPSEKALVFLNEMKKAGIKIVFISNNVEERVTIFANGLDIPCYPFAMKPLKKTYRRMLKDVKIEKAHIAVLGDQLLTDMLGANRMGLHTILTAPIVQRDLSFTKINRIVESFIFFILKLTNRLRKGEFDA